MRSSVARIPARYRPEPTEIVEGHAMFGMLSVLAELQRELIVANTAELPGTDWACLPHFVPLSLYRHLAAHRDGRDCALGSTGTPVLANLTPTPTAATAKLVPANASSVTPTASGSPSAPARRDWLKAILYVIDGIVARIRGIDPNGTWAEDDRGYADVPVTAPLAR